MPLRFYWNDKQKHVSVWPLNGFMHWWRWRKAVVSHGRPRGLWPRSFMEVTFQRASGGAVGVSIAKCQFCGGTGVDPMCTSDVQKGEEPCDPPHPCPYCDGRGEL